MLNKIFRKKIHVYKAKDLMTKHVITLQPQENLFKAQHMMSRYRIKKIVVVVDVDYSHKNKKHPVGILTIKDILKFLISDKTDRDFHEISISEAMSKNLITINKDNSIIDCSKALYNDNKISSLIVVEEDDDEYEDTKGQEQQKSQSVSKKMLLSGIITSTDFTAFFSENCTGLASVKDYMSYPIFTISINEKLLRAAELMIEKNVSQLVVTTTTAANGDQGSSLLGVLSESDISRVTPALKSKTLRSVYENIQVIFASSKRNNIDDSIEPSLIRIQDIFTPNPTTIEKDSDLAEAAKIMIKQGINGIPVTETSSSTTTTTTTEGQEEEGEGGKKMMIKNQQPLGIISKTDIVKALTKLE
jgi:CBS domain-containing protein